MGTRKAYAMTAAVDQDGRCSDTEATARPELPATEIARAESLYAARFPCYATPDLRAYRFYRFRTQRLKVFDEAAFGAEVFVTATIHSGQRLIWERTDISSGSEAKAAQKR